MNQRISWIDTAKGILILLVILGHTISFPIGRNLINGFDMAAFFFLSGYLFSTQRIPKQMLARKAKTLLLPYAVFSILLLLYFFAKAVFFHTEFSLTEGVLSVFFPISGYWKSSVYGLWFLPCLFVTEMTVTLAYQLKAKCRIIAWVCIVAACVGVFAIYFLFGIVSVITITPISICFFALGLLCKSKQVIIDKMKSVWIGATLLLLYLGLIALHFFLTKNRIMFDFSSMQFGIAPLFFLHALAGIGFVISLSQLFPTSRILHFFGRNSIYFYGLHYITLSICSNLLSRFGNEIIVYVCTVLLTTAVVSIYNLIKKKLRKPTHD